MKELQHISIRVAGQSFDLDIRRDQEPAIRNTERRLNKLWARWCEDFPDRHPHEVLAMVAFQYARYYYSLSSTVNSNEEALVNFEHALDDILLRVK